MLGTCIENVRKNVPLVHNITNYVTVNDVANILLACGGSPIMSDEPEDVEDITTICGGLNINIGTLNQRSIAGMFRAGAQGQRPGPCRAAGSRRRGRERHCAPNTAVELMEKVKFDRYPREYFRDQDAGAGQRHDQGRGRRRGRRRDRCKRWTMPLHLSKISPPRAGPSLL